MLSEIPPRGKRFGQRAHFPGKNPNSPVRAGYVRLDKYED